MADYTETIANTLGIIGILEVKSYTIRLIAIFALVYGDDCALKPAPILTFPLRGKELSSPSLVRRIGLRYLYRRGELERGHSVHATGICYNSSLCAVGMWTVKSTAMAIFSEDVARIHPSLIE